MGLVNIEDLYSAFPNVSYVFKGKVRLRTSFLVEESTHNISQCVGRHFIKKKISKMLCGDLLALTFNNYNFFVVDIYSREKFRGPADRGRLIRSFLPFTPDQNRCAKWAQMDCKECITE